MLPLEPTALVGKWRFVRVVDDRLAAQRIAVDGTAVFSPRDEVTIDWLETGVMHLESGDVPVTTRRILSRDGAGSWAVDFANGRGFHPWSVGVELLHDCAPDLYRGRLDPVPSSAEVRADDPAALAWTMRWAASGPAKDYVIETSYRFSAVV